MTFTILGDVHGYLDRCHKVHQKAQKRVPTKTEVIQIGDLGVGFIVDGVPDTYKFKKLPPTFKFFPGNHDNRKECHTLPNCLGDFGEYKGFFFVSGADSHDKDSRTIGIDWWDDEELTYQQLEEAINQWEHSSADTLLSHDGPQNIVQGAWPWVTAKSRTRLALQRMIERRKPKQVFFGHHHKNLEITIDGVYYKCLEINQTTTFTTNYEHAN